MFYYCSGLKVLKFVQTGDKLIRHCSLTYNLFIFYKIFPYLVMLVECTHVHLETVQVIA